MQNLVECSELPPPLCSPQTLGGAPLLMAKSPSPKGKWAKTERGQEGRDPYEVAFLLGET